MDNLVEVYFMPTGETKLLRNISLFIAPFSILVSIIVNNVFPKTLGSLIWNLAFKRIGLISSKFNGKWK